MKPRCLLFCQVVLLGLWGANPWVGLGQTASNSVAKIRTEPNELTRRVGSAVEWQASWATAQSEALRTGRPILWYVSTVPGTFMDRGTEVDRYMQAGPWSWPAIIQLVNENFIPVKVPPTKEQQQQFGLNVYDFIEPGFLVVQVTEGAKPQVVFSADRLTTLHPGWVFHVLRGAATIARPNPPDRFPTPPGTTAAWRIVHEVQWRVPSQQLEEWASGDDAELRLLAGMVHFRQGDQERARQIWTAASETFPEHPLGWKAACEAQGLGPFTRGFEVFSPLPVIPEVVSGQRWTSTAPTATYGEAELWQRGTEFLLGMQRSDGAFVDSDYDFGGTDSLPNVHVAISSLAGIALLESWPRVTEPQQQEQLKNAIERAVAFVANDRNLNFNDRDEILWAQAYRVRLLARYSQQWPGELAPPVLQNAVKQLESLQLSNGSWYHEYANSFVSATALTSLAAAQAQGATVDSDKVNRGLQRLQSQRHANGAYPYDVREPGDNDAGTEQDLAASGGRIAVCELARQQWGQVTDTEFIAAVQKSLKYHELMAKALKYDDHTSTLGYGGFFFWYDMQARSEAIGRIVDREARQRLAQTQRALILELPELDGCFVDSHELGRTYGTAMALISLSHLAN